MAKYLGIVFNNKLSFKNHIMFLEKNVARSVGIVAKLSCYLPSKSLLTLYYSLVHTDFLYALPIWASTCQTYLLNLKRLQNKVIRIIAKAPLKSKLTRQYKKYQILKLEDLILEIGKIMYLFSHDKLPTRFCHYFYYSASSYTYTTRNSSTNSLYLPRFTTGRTQRSIKYIGVKVWNIKQLTYQRFITAYKQQLLYRSIYAKPSFECDSLISDIIITFNAFLLTVNLLNFVINCEFSSPFFLIYLMLVNKSAQIKQQE